LLVTIFESMSVIFKINSLRCGLKGLGVIFCGAMILSGNSAIAQIAPDATLPNNSSVKTIDNINVIDGGTQAASNLFHSFKEFSVTAGTTAYFNNGANIQNIISRVTGSNISNIDGIIRGNGAANLFLINPNGIIFGNNAELNIGGSFIASTASSLNFADGSKFSAADIQPQLLLTVSVPIGLQFGKTASPIRNQSQASPHAATNGLRKPVGLKVQTGKTLALIGGDVILDGGNLTAPGGRIELLSVAGDSKVSLRPTLQGWVFGSEDVQNFQNIQVLERTAIPSNVDTSGEGGGNIKVQGNRILFTGASSISNITQGSDSGGNLTVNAKESVELIGNGTPLITGTDSVGNAGELTITTKNLIIKNGAQVVTYSNGLGSSGPLTVNASDSVELIGGYYFILPNTNSNAFISSAILSSAFDAGNAGEITVNTARLNIQGGAKISTDSPGKYLSVSNEYIPAIGKSGNLTVNAKDSVEITGAEKKGFPVSGLFTSTKGSGDAGNLLINTGVLIVRDRATVNVSSEFEKISVNPSSNVSYLGSAGNLEIQAGSIILDNQGKLTAETDLGKGGDINLIVEKLLILRRNSQISTSAGKTQALGDGGNISINAPNGFIVAKQGENSDITANAFTGTGGRIEINVANIFGITPRSREKLIAVLGTSDPVELNPQLLPTNDITAISQSSPTLNGQVNINILDVDPNRGLVQLPRERSEPKLAQSCDRQNGPNQSKFTITGRSGLPTSPKEYLRGNNVYVDWISLPTVEKIEDVHLNRQQQTSLTSTTHSPTSVKTPTRIIEAQGWIIDTDGSVVLVEKPPTATAQSNPLFTPVHCNT
jgi:filamentous hemagglutinin family protein